MSEEEGIERIPTKKEPLTIDDVELTKPTELSASQADALISVDLGHLMAFDPRPIDYIELKKDADSFIKESCMLSTQLIVNKLFKLPVDRVDDTLVVKLPKPVVTIPREKPLPKKKPPTKWEAYAALKGITKKKKTRKVWDDVAKEWRPVWGMNKVGDKTKQWCLELSKNDDPNTDQFAKRTSDKNERVAKNELQRLRNIARSTKKMPGAPGFTPTELEKNNTKNKLPDKLHLKKQLHMAKTADASMSKFSQKLKDEDKTTRGFGKKRKFESNWNLGTEKEKQLRLFDKLSSNKEKSSKEKLNIDKAANKHIRDENNENSRANGGGKKGGKRRSNDGKHRRVGVKGKGKGKGRK